MDTVPATRKWSELRGIAVMSLVDGKKVGTCDDFYFEPATHGVYALRVKTGMFSHKVLPTATINTIGQDAITMPNEEGLHSESEDERISKLASGQNVLSYKVMSANGTLVGTIGNILLDISVPAALHIAAFELAGGLREHLGGRRATFAAAHVASYGQDVIVIPDEIVQSLR